MVSDDGVNHTLDTILVGELWQEELANARYDALLLKENLVQNFYSSHLAYFEQKCRLSWADFRENYQSSHYFKSAIGTLQDLIGEWHAPFSLPARLLSSWLNEILIFMPPALGGKDCTKVIEAYESGGFAKVQRLLESAWLTPFMAASAWTMLARKLAADDAREAMLYASQKACEIEPRGYRLKYHALRLAENGEYEQAARIILAIQDSADFTPTEHKAAMSALLYYLLDYELREFQEALARFDLADQISVPSEEDASDETYLAGLKRSFPGLNRLQSFCALQGAISSMDRQAVHRLSMAAVSLWPHPVNLRLGAALNIKNGYLKTAAELLDKYMKDPPPGDFNQSYENYITHSSIHALSCLADCKSHHSSPSEFVPDRLCYIVHNSLPYSSGGYATRTAGLTVALKRQGFDLQTLTRPGYPFDVLSLKAVEPFDWIDGITYTRIFSPAQNELAPAAYLRQAAEALKRKFDELRPQYIMAASNHVTALPALLAARDLGLPFIYEVRGLWEITHASKDSNFARSPDFLIQKTFEAEVCKNADLVFALTGGIKNELIARGVPSDKIHIAPNGCNPEKFRPRARDGLLAKKLALPANVPVIGYVGSFLSYEGLEDLAHACGELKKADIPFRLLLVGSENAASDEKGPLTKRIMGIARKLGYENWLRLPGRVPHAEVENYYSLIDIAPFPRRPLPVCEIVSPIKPLEALAMAKSVVASDVLPLAEMIGDGETGFLFKKGNPEDLAAKLAALCIKPELRQALGERGRKFVATERTWLKIAAQMAEKIRNL